MAGKGFSVHHIALKVNDFDRSVAFYEALGFKKFKTWGEGDGKAAMLDMGSGEYFEVFAGGSNEAGGRYFHVALACESCDDSYTTALNAGAKCKSEPKDVDIPSAPEIYPVRIAFVYGPDGEEVEFFQVR